jgi:predicted ATPase
MLKKLYVGNYKSLDNFECEFDNLNLILGSNGNGKSTVFEVLRNIRDFATGRSPISIFSESTLTRWFEQDTQSFELTIEGNNGVYVYRLEVEHERGKNKQRVCNESVTFEGKALLHADAREWRLLQYESGTEPIFFPANQMQSVLPSIGEDPRYTHIAWLRQWFDEKLLCLQIDPLHMKPMAAANEWKLDENATNFVGWYRNKIASDSDATMRVRQAMTELYGGPVRLSLEREGGDILHLKITMEVEQGENTHPSVATYSFSELSDGERSLIVLYTLLQLLDDPEVTLCLDEPDNYVALSEIQPWCISLRDKTDLAGSQALLISHHPQIIDYFAPSYGLVFERDGNGRSSVHRFKVEDSMPDALSASEIFARGWE